MSENLPRSLFPSSRRMPIFLLGCVFSLGCGNGRELSNSRSSSFLLLLVRPKFFAAWETRRRVRLPPQGFFARSFLVFHPSFLSMYFSITRRHACIHSAVDGTAGSCKLGRPQSKVSYPLRVGVSLSRARYISRYLSRNNRFLWDRPLFNGDAYDHILMV